MLISERIDVELEEGPGGISRPALFVWRGQRYAITEILEAWFDAGFAPGERTRTWWRRRHRNYYRVRCADGHVYEMYLDRATPSGREWFLSKRLANKGACGA